MPEFHRICVSEMGLAHMDFLIYPHLIMKNTSSTVRTGMAICNSLKSGAFWKMPDFYLKTMRTGRGWEVSCFSKWDVFVDVKQSCNTIHNIFRIHMIHDLILLMMFS